MEFGSNTCSPAAALPRSFQFGKTQKSSWWSKAVLKTVLKRLRGIRLAEHTTIEYSPLPGIFDLSAVARFARRPRKLTRHAPAHASEADSLHAQAARCRFTGGPEIRMKIPRRLLVAALFLLPQKG